MKKSFPSYKYIFFGNFYFYSPKNMSSRFLFLVSKNEIWISNFSFYSRFYFFGSRQCLVGDVCARYLSVLGLRFFLKGSHSRKGSVNGGRCIQHTNLTIIIGKKRSYCSQKNILRFMAGYFETIDTSLRVICWMHYWRYLLGCTGAKSHEERSGFFSRPALFLLPPVRTGSNQPA